MDPDSRIEGRRKFVSIEKSGKEFFQLKLCTFNAQGLLTKYAQLGDFIYEHDPDVLVVTETYLDATIKNSEFTPPGYQCFRKDRELEFYTEGTYQQLNRGGVMIMVKSFLNPVPYERGEVGAEMVWITISPRPNISWVVGGAIGPRRMK